MVALAAAKPTAEEVSALLTLPDTDANDLAALDAYLGEDIGESGGVLTDFFLAKVASVPSDSTLSGHCSRNGF